MRTKNLNAKKLIAALEATSQKKAWIFSGFLFPTAKVASKSEDILYIIFNSSWNISLAYIRGTQRQFSGKYLFGRRFEN